MINQMIVNLLSPLNIPISFQRYTGKAKQYITFHQYFVVGEDYDDDVETLTGHYVQVDIWSREDYTDLVNQVILLLTKNGFKRLNEIDLYEEETQIYHKELKLFYLEEREVI